MYIGALFKIFDDHPCHFHRGIPLPRAANRLLKGPVINYLPKFSLTWPIFFFKVWVLFPQVQILSATDRFRTYSFGTYRTTEFQILSNWWFVERADTERNTSDHVEQCSDEEEVENGEIKYLL